jgi:hypothetical protein
MLSPRKPTLTRAILPTARHLSIEFIPDSPLDVVSEENRKPFLDYLHPSHVLGGSEPIVSSEPVKSTRKKGSEKKQYLFHPNFMMERVNAPHTHYYVLKRPKDPEEWFVALNELAYHLSEERRNMLEACFWIEWMIEYDSYCRTHSKEWATANAGSTQINKGASRFEWTDGLVPSKYSQDMTWAIWELLLEPSRSVSPDSLLLKLLKNAHVLFCIDYTTASCSRKRFWFYFAILLRTEKTPIGNEKIIAEEYRELIQRVVQKSDDVYQEIKQHEQRPVTDYLMSGIRERNNREDTIHSLEAIQSVDLFQLRGFSGK